MLPTLLSAARITGVMQGLQDIRLLPQQLVWVDRIPDVNALDEEIMARFVGQVLIADLIADDAKAVTYSQGRFQFETAKVPNLKLGISMSQSMLNMLRRLGQQYGGGEDMGLFTAWENRTIQSLLLGIRRRKEALHVAMLTDGLSYDRLGIKMTNVTWGMPLDLKVTPSIAWSSTSATPITDVQAVRRIARKRYGINLNRMTISSSAFEYMTKTTEFKDQAKAFGWGLAGVAQPQIPIQSDATLMQIANRIFGDGFQVELYDSRYWFQDENGAVYSKEFLPVTKVVLTSTDNDNNQQAWDFANGVVTESIVSQLAPVNLAGRIPLGYGPIAYPIANPDLNPPNITYWGVARGFPRKHVLQSSAVLTVGTFEEIISTSVPFPS